MKNKLKTFFKIICTLIIVLIFDVSSFAVDFVSYKFYGYISDEGPTKLESEFDEKYTHASADISNIFVTHDKDVDFRDIETFNPFLIGRGTYTNEYLTFEYNLKRNEKISSALTYIYKNRIILTIDLIRSDEERVRPLDYIPRLFENFAFSSVLSNGNVIVLLVCIVVVLIIGFSILKNKKSKKTEKIKKTKKMVKKRQVKKKPRRKKH